MRRSLLFIPGNNPSMILNGVVFGADCIILDLEDAVSLTEKDAARILVGSMLGSLDREGTEIIIRINSLQSPFWKEDLLAVTLCKPQAIMLPKSQEKSDIEFIDHELSKIEKEYSLTVGQIDIIPLIETAQGIENVYQIARASKRVTAMCLGAEDLTADLGAKRTTCGQEIFYSRSRIVIGAKAAGKSAIDTPFTDVNDDEGLKADTMMAKKLGFDGKAIISPRHVDLVNRVFSPSDEEIEFAMRVIKAAESANHDGKGVISLDGKMIDAPVVARARQIVDIATKIRGRK
jgi:citrate lyase subunit beta/citryl-CoA lyase